MTDRVYTYELDAGDLELFNDGATITTTTQTFEDLAGISAEHRKLISLGRRDDADFLKGGTHGWPAEFADQRTRLLKKLKQTSQQYGSKSAVALAHAANLAALKREADEWRVEFCKPLAERHKRARAFYLTYIRRQGKCGDKLKWSPSFTARYAWWLADARYCCLLDLEYMRIAMHARGDFDKQMARARRRFEKRWRAVGRTAGYIRSLSGTETLPKSMLAVRPKLAWLSTGPTRSSTRRHTRLIRALNRAVQKFGAHSAGASGHRCNLEQFLTTRKYPLARANGSMRRPRRSPSRLRRAWIRLMRRLSNRGALAGDSLKSVATKHERRRFQRELRGLRQPMAWVQYDPRDRKLQEHAKEERNQLTSERIAELTRVHDAARKALPAAADPVDAYETLRHEDVVRRPLPKSTVEAAPGGLTIAGEGLSISDFVARQESFKGLDNDSKKAVQRGALSTAWQEFLAKHGDNWERQPAIDALADAQVHALRAMGTEAAPSAVDRPRRRA